MVIIPYQMLGRNPPKWNSFKPGLLKNWSLRKSLHLDCPWLPRASTEEHRTPKIRGILLWLPSPSGNLHVSHTSPVDNLCPTAVPRDLQQASHVRTGGPYTQLGQNLWLEHGNVSLHLSNREDKWDSKTVPGDLNWVIHIHTNDP